MVPTRGSSLKGHGEGWYYCHWCPFSFTLLFSFLAISQAEKDKILKLSAEILRLEKAVQEERTQNQVLKTELAREKDSSLVRPPATQVLVLWPPQPSAPPTPVCLRCGLRGMRWSFICWVASHLRQPPTPPPPALIGLKYALSLSAPRAHILELAVMT